MVIFVERRGGRVIRDIDIGPAVVVEVAHQHAQAVGTRCFQDAGLLGNVSEGSVAIVVEEDVHAALQAWRAARHRQTFVEARPGFRQRSGLGIEVNVIGYEQVEAPVFIVVEESATCVPALFAGASIGGDAGLFRDVGERAVAVVAPQRAIAPVGDKQVIPSVVVVISRADALTPTGVRHAGLLGHVSECPVAVVLVETADGRLIRRPLRLEARPVDEKNIQPPIVIVINESAAAAGGLEKKLVLALIAEDRLGAQTRFTRHIDELDRERKAAHNLIERENGNRGAQRAYKISTGYWHAAGTHSRRQITEWKSAFFSEAFSPAQLPSSLSSARLRQTPAGCLRHLLSAAATGRGCCRGRDWRDRAGGPSLRPIRRCQDRPSASAPCPA